MARYRGPVCRQCRTSGMKLFLKGERCNTTKCAVDRRKSKPGMHGAANKKQTEYAVQLREKQKIKNIYGLLENQFYKYYEEATRKEGITGELILIFLERRLDNTAFRLGLAKSRNQARQLVRHGHLKVNGRRVDIPSFRIKAGDVITVKEGSLEMDQIKEAKEGNRIPSWLNFDSEKVVGTVVELPKRENVDVEINEQLIVEFYSR